MTARSWSIRAAPARAPRLRHPAVCLASDSTCPDSFEGHATGDNTHKELSKYPWRMDDETVAYRAYEKLLEAGLVNVCVHEGLFPPSVERQYPHLLAYSNVDDVGRAAKDWPRLNFIIYHRSDHGHEGGVRDGGRCPEQPEVRVRVARLSVTAAGRGARARRGRSRG